MYAKNVAIINVQIYRLITGNFMKTDMNNVTMF